MNLFGLFKKNIERKESEARKISTFYQVGQPVQTSANYDNFAKHGYKKNPVVFAAISKISQSCAGIEWLTYQKSRDGRPVEVLDHPLRTLMNRPNPMQSTSSFIESLVAYYKLTGNVYIESKRPSENTPPLELWVPRPDRMKIIVGANGYPAKYRYELNGRYRDWDVDQIDFSSEILHLKTFNPLDDWYGMSPMEAALLSLDQNNSASKWNLSVLQNSAVPSGILKVLATEGNPRGTLTNEQYELLKNEFDENYGGYQNAGRPMVLEGGLDWQTISMSMKDMDFIQSKNLTSHDVAMVYNVPDEILGLGQKTFNNYKEARLAFYEENILPTMDMVRDELNRWLQPAFGGDVYLDYNRDDIEALTYKREQKFATVKDANFLTQNEKRESVGYSPLEDWDVFLIGNQAVSSPDELNGTSDFDLRPRQETEEVEEIDADGKPNENEDENDDEKSFKTFNLLNDNEKQKSLRRQNRIKDRLEAAFEKDIRIDFLKMNEKLVKTSEKITDQNLLQFEIANVVAEEMKKFSKTIEFHLKKTMDVFGDQIVNEGKSVFNITETKVSRKYESYVQDYIKQRTGESITLIEGTTHKQVMEIVKKLTERLFLDGDPLTNLSRQLEEELKTISRKRANLIARTEVSIAANNASREAVNSLEIPNMQKEWVAVQDDRTRDSHGLINGERIDMDEKFVTVNGNDMIGPGDPSAPAEEVINCRCALTYKSNNTAR